MGICFGFGFAAGRGSSNGETVEEKRGGLPRMPGREASELDPDVGDVFQRLEGATNEDFIAELERRLDGDFPERRDARMAFLIRWVMEDAEGAADYLISFFEGDEEGAERYEDVMERFSWCG